MESSKPEELPSHETGDREINESGDEAESGGSNYQITKVGAIDRVDDSDHTEASGQMHTPAIPGRQQIQGPGRHDEPRFLPTLESLFRSWAKQKAELDVLRREKLDLQADLGRLGNVHTMLSEQLAHATRMKNELELKALELEKQLNQREHENGRLEESSDGLKLKVHEFAKEVGDKKKELSELSRINDGLRKDLNHATEDVRAREKTITAFQAEVRKFAARELRKNVLEAEVDKLEDDLQNAQDQIKELMVQQGEMAMEIHQSPPTELEDDGPLPSLEAEIWELVAVNTRDQVDEGEYNPDDVACSTESTTNSGPAAKVNRTGVGTQKPNSSNVESPEKPEENKPTLQLVQTGDASGFDNETKTAKPKCSTPSPQTPEIPAREGDLTPLGKFPADTMPSTFIDGTGSMVIPSWRIDSMYVWPPSPRADSTVIDLEPSPLSLTGWSNVFHGKARPPRGLLPPILEDEGSDYDRFRTDSSTPRLAENTPELTKARLVGRLGSPLPIPTTIASSNRLFDSGISPSMQTKRIFDLSPHRGRLDLQGRPEYKTGDRARFGTPEFTTLGPHARNILYQAASTDFEPQIQGYTIRLPGQTKGQSTQTRITERKAGVDKHNISTERTVQYSSIVWWLLLLCFALFRCFTRSDRQVWMQANEITRKRVLTLRDEVWAKPSWLARMSFDAENALDMDRAMYG